MSEHVLRIGARIWGELLGEARTPVALRTPIMMPSRRRTYQGLQPHTPRVTPPRSNGMAHCSSHSQQGSQPAGGQPQSRLPVQHAGVAGPHWLAVTRSMGRVHCRQGGQLEQRGEVAGPHRFAISRSIGRMYRPKKALCVTAAPRPQPNFRERSNGTTQLAQRTMLAWVSFIRLESAASNEKITLASKVDMKIASKVE